MLFVVNEGMAQIPIANVGNHELRIKRNHVLLRGTWYDESVVDDNFPVGEDVSEVLNTREVIREPITCDQIKMGPDLSDEQQRRLCDLLNEFRPCIALKPDELGCINTGVMHINEISGSKPVARAPIRASFHERKILREIVQELKSQGVVRDSNSDYSSPVLLVPKKTGGYRMVVDYRLLNAQTVKDKFPLPHLDDLLDRLAGFKLFCVLDACQGFNRIPMDDVSARKAAFSTPDGHYEPTRMFFGLANGPFVFQRAMAMALGTYYGKWQRKFSRCFCG